MRYLVFLIVLLGFFGSIRSSESDLNPPPEYAGQQPGYLDTAAKDKPRASAPIMAQEPLQHGFKENSSGALQIHNSTCVCVCPVEVRIIPFLKLSFGLCGVQDSTVDDSYIDQVHIHTRSQNSLGNKEKWV